MSVRSIVAYQPPRFFAGAGSGGSLVMREVAGTGNLDLHRPPDRH
jgi:hypothetical protein